MATQVQFRRGTTTENNAFTGAAAELTVDTTLTTVRVHDGTTAGGVALLNVSGAQTVTNKTFGNGNTWQGNAPTLAYGGTGDNLTAVQGGIVYSTDAEMAIGLAGTAGQVLTSGGTAAPIWVTPSSLTVGTASVATSASNISGGSAGYLVYQYDTDDTRFIQPGLTGYVLQSTGASTAPAWVTSDLTIGSTAVTLGTTETDIAGLTSIDATTSATSFFATPSGSVVLFGDASGVTIGDDATSVSIGASTGSTTVNNDLIVTGDLTVNGTTTTINSTTLTVDDLNVVLASGAATAAAANGAGITVDGANATFTYVSSGDKWSSNKPIDINGAFVVTGDQTNSGDIAVNGGDLTTTASTFNLLDANATTVNAFGDATTIEIGASTGTLTVNNAQTVFDSTDSIQIPVGTTAQRDGTPAAGQIRYNTTTSSFEGYGPGDAWGSLGGVKDVDQDTYIIAETSAGNDDDTLTFYAGGTLIGEWDATELNLKQNLTVDGNATITGTTTFTGGTITLGNADTDAVDFNADVVSNIIPDADNTYNLGSSSKQWADIYGVQGIFSGTLDAGGNFAVNTNKFNVTAATGNTTIAGTLGVTGATTLTGQLTANGGITADGGVFTVADTTGNVHTSGTLDVDGNTNLDGTLQVDGDATFSSNIIMDGDGYIQMDPNAAAHPSHSEGRLFYSAEYKAPTYYNDISGVSNQIGLEEWIRVKNVTGSTISNGTPVYVTGASDETPTVAPADATTLAKSRVIGVATHDIANNAEGVATVRGLVSSFDTSALTAGQPVYVGADGSLQTAAPTAPYFPTDIGGCIISDATDGYIYVRIREHSLEQFRVTGNTQMDGNLSVAGDLTVSGTQTITSQANLALDNAFIYMNSGDTIGEANTTFSGSGLDDAYFAGHFEGTSTTSYYVRIDGVGTGTGGVDTFEWSKDNWSTTEATGVDLAAEVDLDNNISIKFNATTGHTDNDQWSGTAAPLNTDTGWASNRNTGTSGVGYTHLGVIWDTASSQFIVFDAYDPEIEGNVDTGDASFNYGSMRMAGLTATTGTFSGNGSFGGTLSVTSTLDAATGSTIGNLTLANGSITDSSGAISFGNENLSTTGTLSAGAITGSSLNLSTGSVTAGSLDISGNADIDGTMEADAYTVNGTALNEYIADTVGAMVTSNSEAGISVVYQDDDNTLDFDVADFSITLTGDVTGTGTVTNLGNVSFSTTIAANSVALGTDTTGAYVQDITAGNAITISETAAGAEGNVVTINHADTSSQASVNNSGNTYIQDITLDTYGHITGITSTEVPVPTAASLGLGTSSDVQFDSLGVGTAASGTTGEIRATNCITSYYSDARLKNFTGTIDNALDKVMALNGYYFTVNDRAKELGYTDEAQQVGISAQEVEAVLPEVVTDAAINSNIPEDQERDYKTVHYDRMVPLLIEAIKEQQKQIDELKAKLGE
jgi:hypothetical protein